LCRPEFCRYPTHSAEKRGMNGARKSTLDPKMLQADAGAAPTRTAVIKTAEAASPVPLVTSRPYNRRCAVQPGQGSNHFEQQQNQHDGEKEADAAPTIVPPPRACAITAESKPEDQHNQKNDQQHVFSPSRIGCNLEHMLLHQSPQNCCEDESHVLLKPQHEGPRLFAILDELVIPGFRNFLTLLLVDLSADFFFRAGTTNVHRPGVQVIVARVRRKHFREVEKCFGQSL